MGGCSRCGERAEAKSDCVTVNYSSFSFEHALAVAPIGAYCSKNVLFFGSVDAISSICILGF